MQSRRAYQRRDTTAWILDNKLTAYRFAESLGLETPITRLEAVPHAELNLSRGTVVKPLNGIMSQGVYIIGHSAIIDLPRNKTLASIDALRESIASDAEDASTGEDEWIEEKLIMSDHETDSPARDLKFYCFYGAVGLGLETVRSPEVQRCWYTNEGKPTTTGKYSRLAFPGHGIPAGYVDLAKSISMQVPAPFLRIDLLASPDGPVLNEFTPKPGGASQFNSSTDRRLGKLMVSAAGRLHGDLLNGKQFPEFELARQQEPANSGKTVDNWAR